MMLEQPLSRIVELAKLLGRQNSFWIASERVVSITLNVATIVAVARVLGVVDYGHYAFGISILGVGLAFGHLGLDGLLVKKIIQDQSMAGTFLGSVCLAKYLVYLPLFLLAFWPGLAAHLEPRGAGVVRSLAPIFLVLPLSSAFICWLNAQSRFRVTSFARIVAVSIGTAAKLAIVAAGLGVQVVGIGHSLIFFLEAAFLSYLVWSLGGPLPSAWACRAPVFKALFSAAWPLFLASLFAVMYMSADVVALRFLTTPRVVGEYALIPQILQATQIIPFAVTLAAFPALVANNERGGEHLLRHGAGIARTLMLLGSGCGLVLILVVPPILPIAFGEEYAVTGSLLQIAALSLPFLFLRQLTTKMFICIERGKILVGIEAAALVSAVLLNALLIPRFGAFGAAASTVISYSLSALLALASLGLFRPIFGNFWRRNV